MADETYIKLPEEDFYFITIASATSALPSIAGGLIGSYIRLSAPISEKLKVKGCQDGNVILGVRPEDITTEESGADGSNCLEAIVETTEMLGAETLVHLKIGTHTAIARRSRQTFFKAGERIRVTFDGDRIHVFDRNTGSVVFRGGGGL